MKLAGWFAGTGRRDVLLLVNVCKHGLCFVCHALLRGVTLLQQPVQLFKLASKASHELALALQANDCLLQLWSNGFK